MPHPPIRRPARGRDAAAAAVVALALAGCGAGGSSRSSTAGTPTGTPSTTSRPRPVAAPPPGPARSTSQGTPVSIVQCDGTDSGASLPQIASGTTLPAGIAVPHGQQVFGAGIKMAWDEASATAATHPLYLIGHPGMTSVGCYQTPGTPSGGGAMLIFPDNGIYSLGAEIFPAGNTQAAVSCGNADPGGNICGDAADAQTPTPLPTGVGSVAATLLILHVTPAGGAFLGGAMPADNAKPVVELIVQNRNADTGGKAGGFSGVVACSMDDASTCAASLPYFLAQAAANSPMTAADYTRAYTQIATFVSGASASTS